MPFQTMDYNSKIEELLSDARVKVSSVRQKFFCRYKSYLDDQTNHEIAQNYKWMNDVKTITEGPSNEIKAIMENNENKKFSSSLEDSFIAELQQDAADLSSFLNRYKEEQQ